MRKKRKIIKEEKVEMLIQSEEGAAFEESPIVEKKTSGIIKLAINYSNEGLNDMARKINEIIDYLDEKI